MWEGVQIREGLTRSEKNNMLLSPETRLGLRTTGKHIEHFLYITLYIHTYHIDTYRHVYIIDTYMFI